MRVNSCGSDDVLVHVFTIIDSFSESFFVHRRDRGERREKQIIGWLQASIFELPRFSSYDGTRPRRPDKPPEKLKEYLGAAS
jgi:hypothetical protein